MPRGAFIAKARPQGKKRKTPIACFNCGHTWLSKKVAREHFCYGCMTYVCSKCDQGGAGGHGHTKEAHLGPVPRRM
jgi:hypothetical protein